MSQFVLVHGGGHGPAVWELLEPELAQRGHTSVCIDMPIDQPNTGIAAYAEATCDQFPEAGADADVILVGHSLAGRVIPHVANRRSMKALVYLCAELPDVEAFRPSESVRESIGESGETDGDANSTGIGTTKRAMFSYTPDDEGRLVLTKGSQKAAIQRYYHDCTPEAARRAVMHMRPQNPDFLVNRPWLSHLPPVRNFYISCADDRTSVKGLAPRAKRVLGVEPLQMPGGHSPMVSRPGALAELFHLISQAVSSNPSSA